MIWLFIGIALFLALGAVAGEEVRFFGLIPAGVGLAFLIYYYRRQARGRGFPGQGSRPGRDCSRKV